MYIEWEREKKLSRQIFFCTYKIFVPNHIAELLHTDFTDELISWLALTIEWR